MPLCVHILHVYMYIYIMLPQRGELVSIGDPYPSCLVTRTCIQLTKLLNLEININNSLSQEIFNELIVITGMMIPEPVMAL